MSLFLTEFKKQQVNCFSCLLCVLVHTSPSSLSSCYLHKQLVFSMVHWILREVPEAATMHGENNFPWVPAMKIEKCLARSLMPVIIALLQAEWIDFLPSFLENRKAQKNHSVRNFFPFWCDCMAAAFLKWREMWYLSYSLMLWAFFKQNSKCSLIRKPVIRM